MSRCYGYLSGEHLALVCRIWPRSGGSGSPRCCGWSARYGETRTAYLRLDEAHFALEQAQDSERERIIAELERRNVELTQSRRCLDHCSELADERTDGLLRSNLEETAHDLTDWLPLDRGD